MEIWYALVIVLASVTVVCIFGKIFRSILLKTGVEKNICPNCGSSYVKKSSPRLLPDLLYRILGLHPFRCTICEVRFFAFREPSQVRASPRAEDSAPPR